jgi:biopolymer transport protein ExbD
MGIRSTHKIDAGFSLSSMTDLVFLLLIFFVIVSTMVSPYALPVDLPKGKSKPTKSETPQVALRIESAEDIRLNGAAVSPTGIEAALKAEMATRSATDAIVLRVAAEVPTGLMVTVLDMAKRNRWKIVLAAAAKAPEAQPTAQPTAP